MAKIMNIRKIYTDGRHNAFTDIEHWKGYYYVCFRNAGRHAVPGDYGDVFVIRSSDLKSWNVCVRLSAGDKHDDRDPALLNMGDELAVFFGSSYPKKPGELLYEKRRNRRIQSFASFTSDGINWSSPQPIYEENFWLWQVENSAGSFYGVAHDDWGTDKLAWSINGRDWKTIWEFASNKFQFGEAGLWITDKRMYLVIRSPKSSTNMAILAQSEPPYKKWDIKELNYTVHSPVIRSVKGELWIAGRACSKQLPSSILPSELSQEKVKALVHFDKRLSKTPDWYTALWRLKNDQLEPILVLPSRGDCAYPGLVVEENRVLMSYYSQHDIDKGPKPVSGETPSEIYLAEIIP
ncbi:hypothetical protein J7K28_02670 [Candidatus Aerophobetes bacterium]|nr:hypothetical protein [Candidatus Aerophobetes bacterium]